MNFSRASPSENVWKIKRHTRSGHVPYIWNDTQSNIASSSPSSRSTRARVTNRIAASCSSINRIFTGAAQNCFLKWDENEFRTQQSSLNRLNFISFSIIVGIEIFQFWPDNVTIFFADFIANATSVTRPSQCIFFLLFRENIILCVCVCTSGRTRRESLWFP